MERFHSDKHLAVERTLEAAGKMPAPKSITELKRVVLELTAMNFLSAGSRDKPPNHIFHIGEVATLTGVMLINLPDEVQISGQLLAWSHDIGRAVEKGRGHITAGRRILEHLQVDEKAIAFAVAHHNWGQGPPVLGSRDNFHKRAREALANEMPQPILEEIVAAWGIEALVVLLADNSKTPYVSDDIEPSIIAFNEDLGWRLIRRQLDLRKFAPGGPAYHREVTGMKLLAAAVPFIEEHLGATYNPNAIVHANELWQNERRELVAIWREIAYHGGHEASHH